MSERSGSSSIETMRPIRLTWLYQLPSSRTVSAARGSRRMKRSRSRVTAMFSRTLPSSQSYQVGTECGDPSGRRVATTAGLGRDKNSSTSSGTGTGGTRKAYEAATAGASPASCSSSGASRKSRTSRIEIVVTTIQTTPIQSDVDSRRTALVPVAFQSRVGLPQRHCTLVDLDAGATCSHVTTNRLAELLFRDTLPDPTRPVRKSLPELGEVRLGVVGDAEVHERQPVRSSLSDLVDRPVPGVEVELRGRRRRQHGSLGLKPDAGRVAGVQASVTGEITDVVACVSRRGEALQSEHVRSDDSDVFLRNGCELSPERVEGVAVEPPSARFEPARIGQVRRAQLGNVHQQRRMLAHEDPGCARMVEVDVREEEVAQVLKLEAAPAQGGVQALKAGRRAAVVERRTVLGLDDVRRDDALGALMVEVERIRAHGARILPCVRPKWGGAFVAP